MVNFAYLYGGINKANKLELDGVSNEIFMENNMEDAWNLVETINHNKETYHKWEQNKEGLPVDYSCIERFFNTGKEYYLLDSYSLDHDMVVHIIKAYAKYLQVPKNWDDFKPPYAKSFMSTIIGGKLAEEKEVQGPTTVAQVEYSLQGRRKIKPDKNATNISLNINFVK